MRTPLLPRRPARSAGGTLTLLAAIALVGVVVACSTGGLGGAPAVDPDAPPHATVGVVYHHALAANGASPMVWTVTAGSLPTGLAVSLDGALDGTPTLAGSYPFTAQAQNALGSDSASFTLTVDPAPTAPSITGPSLPLANATVGATYAVTFTAAGTAPLSWSISAGALPSGLSLDPTSGQLAGTPTVAGATAFTVAVFNAQGADTRACTLTVLPVATPPSITGPSSPLQDGTINVVYSQTFSATGSAPILWTVTAGALPSGLLLNPFSGQLTGTPTAVQTQTFSITAINTGGSDTAVFQLSTGWAPVLSALSPAAGVVGGTIALQGSGFSTTPSANTVHFGAVAASVLAATATALTVQVPSGIGATESVTVTTGGVTTAARTFTLDATSIVFVRAAASGAADGTSWKDAYPSLQSALAVATPAQEIWIAAGSYGPGGAATDTFLLSSQSLYGGFAGTEAVRSQRDWIAHAVVLTGDVNGDGVGRTNLADNNHQVVNMTGASVLDGCRVTQGNSPGYGGGIVAYGTATVRNVVVFDNTAAATGAGIYVQDGSDLTLEDATVRDNEAMTGAGLRFEGGMLGSSGRLDRVVVAGNTAAGDGGGVRDAGHVDYTNVVFVDNTAAGDGGALWTTGTPGALDALTFSGNVATDGGALYRAGGTAGIATNVIFWGNVATGAGDDLFTASNLTVRSSILATTAAGGGTTSLVGCLSSDPLFVAATDPDGADGVFRTSDDGLRLDFGSPAIDSGMMYGPAVDVLGVARPQGLAYDSGAYERQ